MFHYRISLIRIGTDYKIIYRGKDKIIYRGKDKIIYRGKDKTIYRGKDKIIYRGKDKIIYRGKDKVLNAIFNNISAIRRDDQLYQWTTVSH